MWCRVAVLNFFKSESPNHWIPDTMHKQRSRGCTLSITVLTRYYAPFDYKPPLTICIICCGGISISNLYPPQPYMHGRKIYKERKNSATPTNERKVRTQRTTLHLYLQYWPAIHRSSDWLRGGRLVVVRKLYRIFDRTHSAPSLIISWFFVLQNWATTSFIASRTRLWWTILPLLFPLRAPQRGKGAYKWD